MRALFRPIALAAALAAFAVPAAAEQLTFSLEQARSAARTAFRDGDIAAANAIAHVILEGRPDDTAALLILAATEPRLGNPDIGRRAGARAWASTDNPVLRYEAAYYTSQAAVADERYTAAQFWLRRAYQAANSDEERENLAKTFKRLRAASPWLARFSFDVSPSSNINGGASSEFLVIDETFPVGQLSGAARALSGVQAALQGQLSYTLSQDPTQLTAITFNGYQTFNRLSEEAKEIAPKAEGSDFNYGVAEIEFSHRRRNTPFILPDRIGLAFGQTWYGGEPLDKVTRLTMSKRVVLSPRDALRFQIQGEHRDSDRESQDRQGRELRLDYFRQFQAGHLLSFTVTGKDVTSDDINQAYKSASVRIRAIMGEDLKGFRLSGHLEHAFRDYSDYRIGFLDVEAGREDREFSGELNLHIDRVGYMGFTPVVSLQARSTASNISRFEGESFGISVGFRSAF